MNGGINYHRPLEALQKLIGYARGTIRSLKFQKCVMVNMKGPVKIIKRNGLISVGGFTTFWPHVKLSCVGNEKNEKAKIVIGERCSIGDRTEIHCGKNVTVGNSVIIAWDCVIMDRDYHSPEGGMETIKPVIIKDNVWVGCRSIILKGITVGEGAVIAAGSVVTTDIHPHTLVAGNPAKVVKQVEGWR